MELTILMTVVSIALVWGFVNLMTRDVPELLGQMAKASLHTLARWRRIHGLGKPTFVVLTTADGLLACLLALVAHQSQPGLATTAALGFAIIGTMTLLVAGASLLNSHT